MGVVIQRRHAHQLRLKGAQREPPEWRITIFLTLWMIKTGQRFRVRDRRDKAVQKAVHRAALKEILH